jgi:hypothetical protein
MLRLQAGFFLILFSLAGESAAAQVQLTNAFPSLTFTRPIFLTHAGDGTNRVFVAQQDGYIRVFPNDSAATSYTTFLDIRNKLSATTGEEGLLGLAFHPDYATNGFFYVNYTASGPLRTVVARYKVMQDNPNKADSLSEQVIITINQPYSNHNGGMILFGADGYLYIGMGDGGSGGDPQGHGQNLQSLLGKMLRLDIDTTMGYRIPPTNPFYGNPTAGREELYAWGLRNPWRFSEDTTSGLMLMGDVGQGAWEEIDDLQNGLNYGWRCYEGNAPYNTSGCGPITDYTFPIKVYPHSGGDCSVTGGYIYRGYRRPELGGAYIYGDYCTGKIWLLRYEGGQVTQDSLLINAPFTVSSFGVDADGELYICNYNGNIQRFVGPRLNDPPAAFNLLSPADDSTVVTGSGLEPSVEFSWEASVDPNADTVLYVLQIDTTATFDSPVRRDSSAGTATSHIVVLPAEQDSYYWRVLATDGRDTVQSNAAWRLNVEILTSVQPEPLQPVESALEQNYPNPFNPTTTIKYTIPQGGFVRLSVYNLLGQLLTVVSEGNQGAGTYEVEFKSGDIPSGIYFYRIEAPGFVGTKKMIIAK